MKRKILASLALCTAVATSLTLAQSAQAATPKLNKSSISIYKGKTYKLKVSGTKSKIKWTSKNKKVATVTSSGTVKGVKKGSTYIYAKVGKKTLKCKVTIKENIKLNKTSISVYKGSTYRLKVTGTNSKITWSSSNKTIATVTSSGTVKGVKKGTAYIYARVSGKTLKCKVSIKEKASTVSVSKISYSLKDTGDGVVAIIKNNNTSAVSLQGTLVYYNSSGKMLNSTSDYNFCVEPKATCVLTFLPPYDANYDTVSYSDYKLSLKVNKATNVKYGASSLKIKSNIGTDNVTAEIKNTSSKFFDYVRTTILYFDDSGNVIDYREGYLTDVSGGSTDYISYSLPYDDNYDTIIPDSYKIYINSAYSYSY